MINYWTFIQSTKLNYRLSYCYDSHMTNSLHAELWLQTYHEKPTYSSFHMVYISRQKMTLSSSSSLGVLFHSQYSVHFLQMSLSQSSRNTLESLHVLMLYESTYLAHLHSGSYTLGMSNPANQKTLWSDVLHITKYVRWSTVTANKRNANKWIKQWAKWQIQVHNENQSRISSKTWSTI